MSAQLATPGKGVFPLLSVRDIAIAVGATGLAIVAMGVDHLIGDEPGLADPPTFLIASGLSVALAALVFGRVIPRAKAPVAAAEREARDGLICSVLAVIPGITTFWLGLPFILAGGGVALGLSARHHAPSGRATAAVIIGSLVFVGGAGAYLVQAVDKLA